MTTSEPSVAPPDEPRFLFLNCFSRGGSSIVWNILQSHPAIASPLYETHECFLGLKKGRTPLRHLQFDLRFGLPVFRPVRNRGKIFLNQGLISPNNIAHRRMSTRFAHHMAATLHEHRMASLQHELYGEKRPGVRYTADELAATLLVTKNINGIVWLSPELHRHYPDARFMGLVRDGLALWESRSRRGVFRSVEHFAAWYVRMVEEFERQRQTIPGYRLFRFEDLLDDPEAFLTEIFDLAGVDQRDVHDIRLKIKSHYVDGRYVEIDGGPRIVWVERSELPGKLERRVGQTQRDRVPNDERRRFLAIAGPVMERLGYV